MTVVRSETGRRLDPVARRTEDIANDPAIVVIDDGNEPTMTFDEWLALIDDDEPTEIDLNAADILREFREYGER